MPGVTSTGFVPATIDEIVAFFNAAWRTVFGAGVNVDPQSRNGQEIGIIAEQLGEVWQAGESIAQLFNPNGAVDAGLDNLCAITGTTRAPASKSQATLALTGTPATVVGTGKIASIPGTTSKFATKASATIGAIAAWVALTAYVAGDRRRNGGTQRIYQCITDGISAGAGGPTTTAADIVDGTVHWRFLGPGTGAIDVAAEATVTGVIQGYSGTINTIDTAVGGWSGVINVLDAVPGAAIESNPTLRVRRIDELGGQGVSSLPALRSAILRVKGVTSCVIFENTTDATVEGVTPHAFEAMVEGGADADILATVFKKRPTGIENIGTTSGVVVDAAGFNRTAKFSRPQQVVLYVTAFITKDPSTYPVDGNTQVKDIIATRGNAQKTGRDAEGTELASWLFPRADIPGIGVPGIVKMTTPLLVDTANPPVTAEVVMNPRQKASYDTSRITVVAVDGGP